MHSTLSLLLLLEQSSNNFLSKYYDIYVNAIAYIPNTTNTELNGLRDYFIIVYQDIAEGV